MEQMTEYIALFPGPLFLQASLAAASPRLDLQLWKYMEAHELTEPVIARTIKTSVLRLLWYLTQDIIIIGITVPARLSPIGITLAFPLQSQLCEAQSLASFAGGRSLLIFRLFGARGRSRWLHPIALIGREMKSAPRWRRL